MIRSRKRLSMWSALPPYLGGKRRLCPLIFREIDRIVPRRRWRDLTFLDAFLGGGSVSLYAKAQGFSVISTDIAERAIVIGRALVENSRVRLRREDVLRLLAPRDGPPGRIETTMVPAVFTLEQGRFLDSALASADMTEDPAKANLMRLLAMRTALLCHAYSQVRKGTIHRVTTGEFESITESAVYHYVDGLRLATPKKIWELAQEINAGVFEGRGTVKKRSILEALPEINADIMYADPPYPGVMSYEKQYGTIDLILEGIQRPTSPFTARDGANMLDGLFEQAVHIPIWILSLGNAVVSVEELEAKMAKHGRRTKAIALRYQHLPAVATDEKKATNREFIVIGIDENAPLLHRLKIGWQIREESPARIVEPDVDSCGTEGATAPRLTNQGDKQREPDLTDEGGACLDRQALVEPDVGIDDPDAVLVEGAVGGHTELGLADHGFPASLGGDAHVKEEDL